MADITMAKANIDQNETKYGAAMSESTFSKIGGSINFLNGTNQHRHTWNLNGPYTKFASGDILDGLFIFPTDVEVTAFTMSTSVGGSVAVDIFRLTSPTDRDGTTIFKDDGGIKRPSLSSTDTTTGEEFNGSWLAMSLVDSGGAATATVQSSDKWANAELPVFETYQFNQFDAIYLQIHSASGNGEDLSVNLYFRPT